MTTALHQIWSEPGKSIFIQIAGLFFSPSYFDWYLAIYELPVIYCFCRALSNFSTLCTELLGELAAVCPLEFAEVSAGPVTRLLECLGTFPIDVSTTFLHSLLPLFVVSGVSRNTVDDDGGKLKSIDSLVSLQSGVIMTLQKMATTYSVPVRRIAVAGFVSLLKNLKVGRMTLDLIIK